MQAGSGFFPSHLKRFVLMSFVEYGITARVLKKMPDGGDYFLMPWCHFVLREESRRF
jgi:hypothetical protein